MKAQTQWGAAEGGACVSDSFISSIFMDIPYIHWPSASPPPCPDQPSARPENCGSVAMYGPVAKLEPTATLGQGAQGVHGAMCSLKVFWFFSQAHVAV